MAPRVANENAAAKWFKDPVRVALFLYIVVGLARVHQLIPVLAVFRPGLLTLAVALGFAVLKPKTVAWSQVTASWPGKAMIAFGCLTIVSSFFGLSIGGSASFLISDFSKVLISSLILLAAVRTIGDLRFLLWAYAVSMALWVYMSFAVFEVSTSAGSSATRLSNLYTYDANDLGLILLMGCPLVLMLFNSSEKKSKLVLAGILMGTLATISVTGSRGALVGLAFVALATLRAARHIPVARRLIGVVVAVIALAVAAPPGYWDQMSTLLNPEDDYNVTDVDGRVQLAKRGFGYMLRYPVFGIGPNNFGRAELTISDKARLLAPGAPVRNIAPHNTFVQVGAELGFLGIGLWMYILIRAITEAAKIRRRIPRQWRLGSPDERFLYSAGVYFPIAFIAFAVPSTFVSFAYLTPFFLLLAFYAGYLRIVKERLRHVAYAPPGRRGPRFNGRGPRPQMRPAR